MPIKKVKPKKTSLDKLKTGLFVFIVIMLVCAITVSGGLIFLESLTENSVYIPGPTNYVIPTKPPLNDETLEPDATQPEDVDPNATHSSTGIYKRQQKDKDIINILVLGSDARPNESRGRSDSMMILSYNQKTGAAKMISLLRDSLVPIEGHGWCKLNSAYAFGGAELTINTINLIFDMDIQYYVVIGFDGLVDVVDTVGGVRVNVTKEESDLYIEEGHYESYPYGDNVLLNGKQALTHARNRHLSGGDWQRTRRQRDILIALIQEVKKVKDPGKLLKLTKDVFNMVKTNMTVDQIYNMGMDVLKNSGFKIESGALPFEGTWEYATYKKGSVIDFDLEKNKIMLNSLIYG